MTIPLNKVIIPIVDVHLLGRLQAELGDAFNELIDVFTQDTADHLNKLKSLIEHDDNENMKTLLQYLSGSATNIGAERLKHHYSHFITKPEDQDHRQLLEKYQSLLKAFNETSTDLQQFA
ncbi:hypothetical protein MNBD_GAMMA23-544 [hydrothermal vent metagenome]|uniref:HPt domain-containing protein n=1 Tax=hydrothermal vent metagenome TaxID=652676 RepID=A0A3B1A8D3_9ZZZZ